MCFKQCERCGCGCGSVRYRVVKLTLTALHDHLHTYIVYTLELHFSVRLRSRIAPCQRRGFLARLSPYTILHTSTRGCTEWTRPKDRELQGVYRRESNQ